MSTDIEARKRHEVENMRAFKILPFFLFRNNLYQANVE
jgi:hypothetical protein